MQGKLWVALTKPSFKTIIYPVRPQLWIKQSTIFPSEHHESAVA